jgi:hypothetical protein
MNDAEKKKCSAVVDSLGGQLISSVGFDPRCTHLIVSHLSSYYKIVSKFMISTFGLIAWPVMV